MNGNEMIRKDGELYKGAASKIAALEREIERLSGIEKSIKSGLLNEMTRRGIKSVETDDLQITLNEAFDRESFDSKAFRKDNPEAYDAYVKISTVAPSVRIKVKGNA